MGKLQEQITTGKRVNRPSDGPVIAMKGMAYRMQVDKVAQYKENLGEVNNWLDSSDDALDHVGKALHRANDLMVSAPNGTLSQEDREAILAEIKQLREQVKDIANTKVGDKYIFSGTKTGSPAYAVHPPATDKGYPPLSTDTPPAPKTGFENSVEIEVFDGITMNVNTDALKTFKNIDKMFDDIEAAIMSPVGGGDGESGTLTRFIGETQTQMDDILTQRANIGARQNRSEMMGNRLDSQESPDRIQNQPTIQEQKSTDKK